MKTLFLPLLFCIVVGPVRAQETGRPSSTAVEANRQDFFSTRTLLAVTNSDYLVSPGDVYTLTYNRGLTAVTQYLIVGPDMKVDLSTFGREDVENMSFVQFKRVVEDKVRAAYRESFPQVTIRSTGVFEVLLKGEVERTGPRLAWGLTRLSEIVREELTPRASVRSIQVISSNGRSRFYDLYRASRSGEDDQDPFVRPGDTIVVTKYDRQVKVSGEVERPGRYQLLPAEHLEKVIVDYGSGPTAAADLSRVELCQYDPVQKIEKIKYMDITRGYDPAIVLRDGDWIHVPSRADLLPVVYFEGAIVPEGADPQERMVVYRQKHTIRHGETLRTALRSVVLSARANLSACYVKRKEERIFVDLDEYLYNPDSKKDVVLQPLDCIVIPYVFP